MEFLTRSSPAEPPYSNIVTLEEEEDSFEKAVKAPILKTLKLPTIQGPFISHCITPGMGPTTINPQKRPAGLILYLRVKMGVLLEFG